LNQPGSYLPSPLWSGITVVALIGWITAVALATWRGFRPDGSLSGKESFLWLGVFVILYLFWLIGVTMI